MVLCLGPSEVFVKQLTVYSDKTDAYNSDMSTETCQPIGRESPATVADCL